MPTLTGDVNTHPQQWAEQWFPGQPAFSVVSDYESSGYICPEDRIFSHLKAYFHTVCQYFFFFFQYFLITIFGITLFRKLFLYTLSANFPKHILFNFLQDLTYRNRQKGWIFPKIFAEKCKNEHLPKIVSLNVQKNSLLKYILAQHTLGKTICQNSSCPRRLKCWPFKYTT